MSPRGLIFHALVPLAPGDINCSELTVAQQKTMHILTISRAWYRGAEPPHDIAAAVNPKRVGEHSVPGGSIVVNAPLLSKKPCLPDIGSVGSRYVPTMSPRPLIAAARVKLVPGISIAMNCPLLLRKNPWVPLASLY